jgi:hypothetical protein
VPAAVLGERRLPIFHVDQLRGFLGLPPGKDAPPYQELVAALERVLEGVERAALQVPAQHFHSPTPNRGRDIAELVFNIHDPIALMREALDSGRFAWDTSSDFERSRHFSGSEGLAGFCREVRLEWFTRAATVDDEASARMVETERGSLTSQQVLEAQAEHAGRHLRQIYVFLRRLGIEPTQELLAADILPISLGDLVF